MNTTLIELNVPVERDGDGYWSNPAIPDFEEDHEAYRAWLDAQGIEITYADLQDEDESHPAYHRHFELGDPDISDWTPEAPKGEGWHTFSIHAYDDGAAWCWARRKA